MSQRMLAKITLEFSKKKKYSINSMIYKENEISEFVYVIMNGEILLTKEHKLEHDIITLDNNKR